MASAIAVPFPVLNNDPPTEREPRLEAIVANLKHYQAEVRNNILTQAATYIHSIPPSPHPTPHQQTTTDNNELASLLSTPRDPQKSDYSIQPSALKSHPSTYPSTTHQPSGFGALASAARQTEQLLDEYEIHAAETLKIYQDALTRAQAAAQSAGSSGGSGGVEAQTPTTPSTPSGAIGPQRTPTMGQGSATAGRATRLIHPERDPRLRRGN